MHLFSKHLGAAWFRVTTLSLGRLLESFHVLPCMISWVQKAVHLRTIHPKINERKKEGSQTRLFFNLSKKERLEVSRWFTNVSPHWPHSWQYEGEEQTLYQITLSLLCGTFVRWLVLIWGSLGDCKTIWSWSETIWIQVLLLYVHSSIDSYSRFRSNTCDRLLLSCYVCHYHSLERERDRMVI